jgi:hypothetical protein
MKINKEMKLTAITLIITVVFIYTSIWLYSFIFEQDKLAIDRYNFEQLEKAKPILENMPKLNSFYWLKEFNEKLKANIQPIENCYFVANFNWNQKYIFWFQLKSKIYILMYFWDIYFYPSYDIPYHSECDWFSCYDRFKNLSRTIVSQPCQD